MSVEPGASSGSGSNNAAKLSRASAVGAGAGADTGANARSSISDSGAKTTSESSSSSSKGQPSQVRKPGLGSGGSGSGSNGAVARDSSKVPARTGSSKPLGTQVPLKMASFGFSDAEDSGALSSAAVSKPRSVAGMSRRTPVVDPNDSDDDDYGS
jgi:hypothetical protein